MRAPLKFFATIVGPAAVMAAGTMGAGATASLILAGAWFRYDLIWVAVAVLPLFVFAVDSASRIGLTNRDTGMFSLIRQRIHPGIAWLILAINLPVHLLIAMGQMSVMTAAVLFLLDPVVPGAAASAEDARRIAHLLLSIVIAGAVVWMLTSEGYQRMQKLMTAMMVIMLVCFLLVALRGFQEIGAILAGLVPRIPPDAATAGGDIVRQSEISITAIIGSVLAPAALLGIPYMSADNSQGATDFRGEFRKSVINLGFLYGGYSLLVIIAGGFALFPLADHVAIDSIQGASEVLVHAFPAGLGFLGPVIFSLGLFMAALTTFIVVVEVISYFCLDMFGRDWHYSKTNTRFKRLTIVCIVLPALLAPFWTFPELLKVLLLMGVNTIVIPLVFLVVIILVNRRDVMGEHRAGGIRNILLVAGLLVSTVLSVIQLPDFVRMLAG
jgi:Mn2+/Fe2+ NRAMP family transporter